MKKLVLVFLLSCIFINPIVRVDSYYIQESQNKTTKLTTAQNDAVILTNYFMLFSQRIINSKNSRLMLDDLVDELVNNLDPAIIDENTQEKLGGIAQTIKAYDILAQKREQIELVYEQNKAIDVNSIASSIDPLEIVGMVATQQYGQIITVLLTTSVNTYLNGGEYQSSFDSEYLSSKLELDQQEKEMILDTTFADFDYVINQVKSSKVDSKLFITKELSEKFVEWDASDEYTTEQKINFFESNKANYKKLSAYWATLAELYFLNGDYKKCLSAIEEYENLGVRIFRTNKEYASIIPFALYSTKVLYESDKNYISKMTTLLNKLEQNMDPSNDWELSYIYANTYYELFQKKNNAEYLTKAYEMLKNSINNCLMPVQTKLNNEYTQYNELDSSYKDYKEYNSNLKKAKETQLPEVYEPLCISLNLFGEISWSMGEDSNRDNEFESLLHGDTSAFLSLPVSRWYLYNDRESFQIESKDLENRIEFEEDTLSIPVTFVSSEMDVYVCVDDTLIDDWELTKINKNKSTYAKDYTVIFKSKDAKKAKIKDGSVIKIFICPNTTVFEEDIYRCYYVQFLHATQKKILFINSGFEYAVDEKSGWYDVQVYD